MSDTDTKEATSETIDDFCQEVMRCYERHWEESIETFNRVSDQTIDLFEKTLDVYPGHLGARCAGPRAGSDRKLAERPGGSTFKAPKHER